MQPPPPICPICLNPVIADLELTPCNHAYHRACLDGWRVYNQCPSCRAPLDPGKPVLPVQYDGGDYQPVLQAGDVGYQGNQGYQPAPDQGGYQAPPNSPAEIGTDTLLCPACQVVRAWMSYAPGLGGTDCVTCDQPCQVGVDYLFYDCWHPLHAVCPH